MERLIYKHIYNYLIDNNNNVIVELISVSMSFMKTMNKRDPKIDPWGPHQPNLIMNNTIISTVTEHKHPGLQLSHDGNSWIMPKFCGIKLLRY
jgi:hypothetical protein